MLTARRERRADRKRAEREEYACKFTAAVAVAGFFGPLEAHVRGGHEELIDPRCELCQSHGVPERGPRWEVAA